MKLYIVEFTNGNAVAIEAYDLSEAIILAQAEMILQGKSYNVETIHIRDELYERVRVC